MKVTITDACDRCKRETPRDVDSSELPRIEESQKQHASKVQLVGQSLLDQAKEPGMPDLVIFFKGQVHTICRVCEDHCAKTVQNSIDTICKVIEKRKGKPKKKYDDSKKAKTKDSGVKDDKPPASSSKS